MSMNTWYLCKISYFKTSEDGTGKKVSEMHLVDAVSFTEAEARLYKELEGVIPDFTVKSVTVMDNFGSVHKAKEAGHWFKCRTAFATCDDDSGKEKTITNTSLVCADDLIDAFNIMTESLKSWQVPVEITDINKTKILDVHYWEGANSGD